MIVCHCAAVNDATVAAAAAGAVAPDGTVDVDLVTRRCGAGGDCGSCLETLVDLAAAATRPPRLLAG